jgi:Tfp pilus assembly protein PilZ
MTNQCEGRDKRKSPRIDFHLSVNVKGKKEIQKVTNFGLYGVFLETPRSFDARPGDEISLLMKLPHEEKTLELKGRIVHVAEKGVGVAFPDVPPHTAMCMEACFNIFKATLPLPDRKPK